METGSRSPYKTQLLQLCAVMIDSRKLEVVPNSIFKTYVRPIPDQECEEYGLDKVEDEALQVNHITRDILDNAPAINVIWPQFINYVNQYNKKKTIWTAPVLAGYNSNKFDDIILDRICGGNKRYNQCKKEPYALGPWDDEQNKNKLFHPRDNLDIMKLLFYWFENDKNVNSYALDIMREKFGINKEGAHNAVVDTLQEAHLLIKFLKLARYIHERMEEKFNNCFDQENKIIAELVKQST